MSSGIAINPLARNFLMGHRRTFGIVHRRQFVLLLLALIAASPTFSDTLSGKNLLAVLRAGGYIILMRHASSPRQPPDSTIANADNPRLERQLDVVGRASANDMGEALRHLRIPIGAVLSSPTYRALETIRLAQLGPATTFPELGDSGQSMMADDTNTRGAWLKAKTAAPPAPGKNSLIVSHYPNIVEAYPQEAAGLADGEALILRPDPRGGTQLVARLKIDQWASLDADR
jgi:phosphohistidine phosphatase SixA